MTKMLKDLWFVKADVFMCDPEGKLDYIEVPHFVGLSGKHKLIKFEENLTKDCIVFATHLAAEKWCNEHNTGNCFTNGDFYPFMFDKED